MIVPPLQLVKKEPAVHLMGTYKREITLVEGRGCIVYDDEGKAYLDLVGGIATCTLGHADLDLVATLTGQAARLINPSNLYHSLPQQELAKKLVSLSGIEGGKVFLSNSGSEAVECALKVVRKHGSPGKVVVFEGAFHGRTMGSLSATWGPRYREPFAPLVPGFVHLPFGDIEALKEVMDGGEISAVLLEPIQGEAGVVVPPPGFLKQVEQLCAEHGALLVLDEVQTGVGRTGEFFCYQHEAVQPDVVCVAKGLGNGLPIGATIVRPELELEPGDHGSTFGGNCLCSAAALKVVQHVEELMPTVAAKGEQFMALLSALSSVVSVRGKGLMVGVVLDAGLEGPKVVAACAGAGLLVNSPKPDLLRFLPPLTVSEKELATAVGILGNVLEDLS